MNAGRVIEWMGRWLLVVGALLAALMVLDAYAGWHTALRDEALGFAAGALVAMSVTLGAVAVAVVIGLLRRR